MNRWRSGGDEKKFGITDDRSIVYTRLEKNSSLVIGEVPVDMCDNCGDTYVPDKIAQQIISVVESVQCQEIIVDVRNFNNKIFTEC